MRKFYIEPKTIYIDLSLEEPINATSDPNANGGRGDDEDYTRKQGNSDVWNNWTNASDN